MSRSELEIMLLSVDARVIFGVGFAFIVFLCLTLVLRTGQRFPLSKLLALWSLTVLAFYCVPTLIHAYAHARLTDTENLFFLAPEAVGTSYSVLLEAFNRWSDMQLAILTGSVFIVPMILVGAAHLSALMLVGLYRLIDRSG